MRDEPVLNRQVSKFKQAKKQKKRIKRDALIYSVTSNDTFDVASYNKAWILKVSRGDIWFLSNIALPQGNYVYLGLNMKGTDAVFNSNGFHLILIKYRTDSDNSSYRFRYQATYINSKGTLDKPTRRLDYEKQVLKKTGLRFQNDPRDNPRKSCRKTIFFHSKENKYQGIITNLSRGGAFIETKNNLSFGQTIEISVPEKYSKEDIKIFGEVVRLERNGVALNWTKILDPKSGKKPRISSPPEDAQSYRIPDLRRDKVNKRYLYETI